jgi:hypothetical protein
MKLTTSVSLEYKKIFSDYDSTSIDILLAGVPSKKALEVICHFYAQMHTREQDTQLQRTYLLEWLDKIPSTDKKRISEPILKTIESVRNNGGHFNFFNNYSTLILIQNIIKNHNNLPSDKVFTDNQIFQLFKAYLYCTQEWIDKQPFKTASEEPVEKLIEMLLPVQFPQVELVDFKDFRMQLIKAVYFFKFCEVDLLFKSYLSIFLKEKGISTWQDYLKYIADIYTGKLIKKIIPSVMQLANTEENKELIQWLEGMCVDPSNFELDIDFKGVREHPVYKYDNDEYLFLNFNFFIDKIYQGIKFEFAQALIKNNAEYKGKPIKGVGQFLGIYGECFSESGLFYEVLNHTFEKSKYNIKVSGDALKTYFPKGGEPDYYMREKGKVYLFEYKDVTFASDYKNSLNYEKIKSGLFEKFVADKKGKPEGVSQLVQSIEKIIDGQYNQFDNYNLEMMTIYPILVFTDMSFNTPGVNFLLNREMRKQIEEKGLHKKVKIERLIMIDIDHLIKFQEHIRTKKMTFNHCLNGYNTEVTSPPLLSKVSSFTHWIHNKTYDMPNMNDPLLKGIIEDIVVT